MHFSFLLVLFYSDPQIMDIYYYYQILLSDIYLIIAAGNLLNPTISTLISFGSLRRHTRKGYLSGHLEVQLTHKIKPHRVKKMCIWFCGTDIQTQLSFRISSKLQLLCWSELGFFISVQPGKDVLPISVICGLSDWGPQLMPSFSQVTSSVSCHVSLAREMSKIESARKMEVTILW